MKPSDLVAGAWPAALVAATFAVSRGQTAWVARLGATPTARHLAEVGSVALPFALAATIAVITLFAARGARSIRPIGVGVTLGSLGVAAIGIVAVFTDDRSPAIAQASANIFQSFDPGVAIGVLALLIAAGFALRIALRGDAGFPSSGPKRATRSRAIHGDARWMSLVEAERMFPPTGGIVVGERHRPDLDGAGRPFRVGDRSTWGRGGAAPLLAFDGAFGSGHGLAFAGSGGFKTTSVTIPTALRWGAGLVVLDPSNEVAPMVAEHRRRRGRTVFVLSPKMPEVGFNVLDWIGRWGGTREEDIAAVASWIVTDVGNRASLRDDFFRAAALQLLTALIADVCLSGHTPEHERTLRRVRENLAEPEPKLRERLQAIWDRSNSAFVRENVAPFIAMTPETFSGVYASAAKETHWLSYPALAALVSGSSFATDEIADGGIDVFLALDLKTLETHPGLARVVVGALMTAVVNRDGRVGGRTLFLLDEVARLGFMALLETARDAGRKYGISLLLLFQSIGQMREAWGGRDASSKWFESASWVSFAAINDPETAEWVAKRCGDTTVEVDQVSRSSRAAGASTTRSRQLVRRPLILPHEVMQMRTDEQIVFTAGNPPLRCGRAIWFRRDDMKACVAENRFERSSEDGGAARPRSNEPSTT